MRAALLMLAVASVGAQAQRMQCQNDADKASVRVATLAGSALTVTNPKTSRIGGPQAVSVERRGDITKADSEGWTLYIRGGSGTLKNKTFGDSYTCIQIG